MRNVRIEARLAAFERRDNAATAFDWRFTATDRIRSLEADNQQLRAALARALGERRAADVLGQTSGRDTPRKHSSSKLIGPC